MRGPLAALGLVVALSLVPGDTGAGKKKAPKPVPLPITDSTLGGPGISVIPANVTAVVWIAQPQSFTYDICVTVGNPSEVPVQVELFDGFFQPAQVALPGETIARCRISVVEVRLRCADPLPCTASWRVDSPR